MCTSAIRWDGETGQRNPLVGRLQKEDGESYLASLSLRGLGEGSKWGGPESRRTCGFRMQESIRVRDGNLVKLPVKMNTGGSWEPQPVL